jgi:hypothetical protein
MVVAPAELEVGQYSYMEAITLNSSQAEAKLDHAVEPEGLLTGNTNATILPAVVNMVES